MSAELERVRAAIQRLAAALRAAGVPPALIESVRRKCLRTPRRQTGRPDRRTNREPRWQLASDHPDYSTEIDAHLIFLRLLLDMLRMLDAPRIDPSLVGEDVIGLLHSELTDEPLRDP